MKGHCTAFLIPSLVRQGSRARVCALYYYTEEGNDQFTAHSTDYFARPEDGWGKSAMIWLDKKAVDFYSRAKARFGFSDKLASKVLRFLSGKK